MIERELTRLQELGFMRTYCFSISPHGWLWYKRSGSAIDIVKQCDGATKHEDLGDGHPRLYSDKRSMNRRWAVELAGDPLVDWHPL